MNTTSRVVVKQADEGRTIAVVGDVYRFLAPARTPPRPFCLCTQEEGRQCRS